MKNKKLLAMMTFITLAAGFMAARFSFAEVLGKIAAVVNSEIITEHELDRAMSAHKKTHEAGKPDTSPRQETLDRMIDDKLLNQIMAKSKIEVTDEDMARAIAGVLHQNRMSIDQLKHEIAGKGMSYDEYKKQIEKDIKRIKFINQVIGPQVKISDQDLRDYYQQNQERFRGSQKAHIAQIVLPLTGLASQADFDKVRDTAMSITARARHGSGFDALAKQYSKGPNAENGGDLGMINLKDLPPELSGAVRSLKIGEVSGPTLVGNAVVIVKLIALPEISAADFDKFRDDIYSAIYDQKIEEALNGYLTKERQRAFIEVRQQ